MCDGYSWVYAVVSIVSAVTGAVSANESADAQADAVRAQLKIQQEEKRATATAEINDRLRDMRREQARIKVAAGEAGLQLGGSIDLLLKDSLMQQELFEDRVQQNLRYGQRSTQSEADSMLSRIDTVTLGEAALGATSSYANMGGSFQIPRSNPATSGGVGSSSTSGTSTTTRRPT
jgi:hypothetical protein